jgi:hypothetical protein
MGVIHYSAELRIKLIRGLVWIQSRQTPLTPKHRQLQEKSSSELSMTKPSTLWLMKTEDHQGSHFPHTHIEEHVRILILTLKIFTFFWKYSHFLKVACENKNVLPCTLNCKSYWDIENKYCYGPQYDKTLCHTDKESIQSSIVNKPDKEQVNCQGSKIEV